MGIRLALLSSSPEAFVQALICISSDYAMDEPVWQILPEFHQQNLILNAGNFEYNPGWGFHAFAQDFLEIFSSKVGMHSSVVCPQVKY
jgi:hypothetical protein